MLLSRVVKQNNNHPSLFYPFTGNERIPGMEFEFESHYCYCCYYENSSFLQGKKENEGRKGKKMKGGRKKMKVGRKREEMM